MKRNFFVNFIVVVSFLFFCGIASAKMSDFLSGGLGAGISVDSIDMPTGVRLYEGLGHNSNLTFATKKRIGILPAGIIVGAGYSSDVEGSECLLAKALSFSLGWMNSTESQNRIKFSVSKLDLHDFFNRSGKGDAVKFKLDSESQIWRDDDEVHFVDAVFTSSATVPIISDEKWLRGFNAALGVKYSIEADDKLSVIQEIQLGADDGSFGYPAALLLSYQIYLRIKAENWNFKFPRISGIYASENGGDYNLRRDKEMLCAGCSVEYNFW